MKRAFFSICMLTVAGVCGFAQDILTAEKFLASVADRYAALKDYQAEISIDSGNVSMIGTIIQKRPNLLRIDFDQPEEQVIAYNGDELTVYLPEYRAVLSQSSGSGNKTPSATLATPQGLALLRKNYVPAYVSGPDPVPLDEGSPESVIKLVLTRRSISEGFKELRLSVIPDTLLIRRIEGTTIAAEQVVLNFTDIIVDQGIPEARFVYDSPASANRYNNFLFKETD